MTEEIKEMLHCIEINCKHNKCFGGVELDEEDCKLLLDYITNLQQDLDKANDIIEKDRQFYKCRMDEYAELKKENERLKEELKNRYERIRNERDDMKNKFNELMNNSEKIDKATSIYLKELSKKGKVDDLACRMFNVLEENK